MRFSEYFELERQQAFLDFVDIPMNTDLPVFVDPTALRSMNSKFAQECASLIQHFFETILSHMKSGRNKEAVALLSSLNERNEFRLGYSKGRPRGHAFGAKSAASVWGALAKSAASTSGLLRDLEDSCLLIEGVGRDMISDAVCNIIRGPLIRYTQSACGYYGVPLTADIPTGPVWDVKAGKWSQSFSPLPMTTSGKIILVPKIFVRQRLSYEMDEYYRHYLLPEMQRDEMERKTGLVELLRDGRKRVTKKKLMENYGADKLAIIRETLKHPQALDDYRAAKSKDSSLPLGNAKLSELENAPTINWDKTLSELKKLPVGNEAASQYEDLIEKILSAAFYPSLTYPTKQHELHQGRKRVDITYTNEAKTGFFAWLSSHYSCAFIFVECKNYGSELGNPELDQISGRFSPSRGQVGLLICRKLKDKALMERRCKDTAQDQRGFIIVLTDEEIFEIVDGVKSQVLPSAYPLLTRKFRQLVD